jgi:hypothetical protein
MFFRGAGTLLLFPCSDPLAIVYRLIYYPLATVQGECTQYSPGKIFQKVFATLARRSLSCPQPLNIHSLLCTYRASLLHIQNVNVYIYVFPWILNTSRLKCPLSSRGPFHELQISSVLGSTFLKNKRISPKGFMVYF